MARPGGWRTVRSPGNRTRRQALPASRDARS